MTVELNYSAAGLLFPAISLLMLAYTNRFLGLAAVARNLVVQYRQHPDVQLQQQVLNLQQRLMLIRHTQAIGVLSLSLCTACLLALLFNVQILAQILFGSAILLMLASLVLSLTEIYLSVRAINLELESIVHPPLQLPEQNTDFSKP